MSHSDTALRKVLQSAAAFEAVDFDTAPVKTIVAVQGGGSWSIAAAEALKVTAPRLQRAGSIEAVSGTSGGAANAVLLVKALNEGLQGDDLGRYLTPFWKDVRLMGSMFSVPRIVSDNPFLPAEDRWPNIPQGYIALADVFRSVNPLVQMSMSTTNIKILLDKTIGNWSSVQNGPTAVYTNSIQQNIFTRKKTYQVKSRNAVDGDAVAESAGLDELGGHLRLNEIMSPLNWVYGDINRYMDGAYRLNPDIETMLANHDATDVVVIALHGADGGNKSAREKKLYTDEIHRDLTSMQLDDGRSVNFHVVQIQLPGNATSRLNTDPEYLDLLARLGREQAEAQIGSIMDSLGVRSSYHPKATIVQDMIEKRELATT